MKIQRPLEETARVLAVAGALWGSVIAIAAIEGAFARFEGASLAMLAVFVSLFAVASYFLDPQLRAYADGIDRMRASAFAVGALGALAVALASGSAPMAMLLAPFAALAVVATVTRAGPRGIKSASPAKSPGAKPAAT